MQWTSPFAHLATRVCALWFASSRSVEVEQWRQALAGAHDAAAAARRSKFAVKESQSLARVPDTLVFAFEFIMLPTPNEQAGDLEVLRRTILRLHPDLKARAWRTAAYLGDVAAWHVGGVSLPAACDGVAQPTGRPAHTLQTGAADVWRPSAARAGEAALLEAQAQHREGAHAAAGAPGARGGAAQPAGGPALRAAEGAAAAGGDGQDRQPAAPAGRLRLAVAQRGRAGDDAVHHARAAAARPQDARLRRQGTRAPRQRQECAYFSLPQRCRLPRAPQGCESPAGDSLVEGAVSQPIMDLSMTQGQGARGAVSVPGLEVDS